MDNNYLEIPALRVHQPLGDFYAISISAKHLLELTFSEPLRYIDNSGNVQGSQRPRDVKRLKEIAKYIDTSEMAFPNSIILAANYSQNGEFIKDESNRWKVIEENGIYRLLIPKKIRLAAIIDGQHRVNAFEYVSEETRFTDLQLICSVYFDLPNSYQAFLFATVNSNQKKVDRSLALEQFGYNINDEPEKSWTPEKFAVFLSRKLNKDKEYSPLYSHIKVAPLGAEVLFTEGLINNWTISTATIVDGICSLISSNVKRDRILMQQHKNFFTGRSREILIDIKDLSPLRQLFLRNQDLSIYNTLLNFFNAVNEVFWKENKGSYINKTVGIQALFDVLKNILIKENSETPDQINFKNYLLAASGIDFSDKFFQASGIGRSRIKNAIMLASKMISVEKIKKNDIAAYNQIMSGQNTNTIREKWLWEDEAENTIIDTLENIKWNYDDKTVSLIENYDYDKIMKFDNYQDFFNKLVELADVSFASNLPSDEEFVAEQREKFDVEDLVNSQLLNYQDSLKQLGWSKY